MEILTQDALLNGYLKMFPDDKELIEKVRAGYITRKDKIINDNGMSFLFLGPCNQCGEYEKSYVIVNTIDDCGREIEGLMCGYCVNKAMELLDKN